MGLVVGHEQQLVRRGEAVLPAVQLPGGDLAPACEQLDLRDIEFIALPGLTAPDQALALQITEMGGRCAAGTKFLLRHEQVIAHCTHQGSQHLFEQVKQRILAIASLLAIQDGEDVLDSRAGDAIAEQALQERDQGLALLFRLVLKELLQELVEAGSRGLQSSPLGRDGGFEVVIGEARLDLTRL